MNRRKMNDLICNSDTVIIDGFLYKSRFENTIEWNFNNNILFKIKKHNKNERILELTSYIDE